MFSTAEMNEYVNENKGLIEDEIRKGSKLAELEAFNVVNDTSQLVVYLFKNKEGNFRFQTIVKQISERVSDEVFTVEIIPIWARDLEKEIKNFGLQVILGKEMYFKFRSFLKRKFAISEEATVEILEMNSINKNNNLIELINEFDDELLERCKVAVLEEESKEIICW